MIAVEVIEDLIAAKIVLDNQVAPQTRDVAEKYAAHFPNSTFLSLVAGCNTTLPERLWGKQVRDVITSYAVEVERRYDDSGDDEQN